MMKTASAICCLLSAVYAQSARAALTDWWDMPTICRQETATCYHNMGAGYEATEWDITGNCWGMKQICYDALKSPSPDNKFKDSEAKSKKDIKDPGVISADFDTDTLVVSDGCFGQRKTAGNMTYIEGKLVEVWCPGILDGFTVELPNGEARPNPQPTCADLAKDNIVALPNGDCWGKEFPSDEYEIVCEGGSGNLPGHIIVKNGSEDITFGKSGMSFAGASTIFDDMQRAAAAKKSQHFKK